MSAGTRKQRKEIKLGCLLCKDGCSTMQISDWRCFSQSYRIKTSFSWFFFRNLRTSSVLQRSVTKCSSDSYSYFRPMVSNVKCNSFAILCQNCLIIRGIESGTASWPCPWKFRRIIRFWREYQAPFAAREMKQHTLQEAICRIWNVRFGSRIYDGETIRPQTTGCLDANAKATQHCQTFAAEA